MSLHAPLELLKDLNFGERIAEEEGEKLENYFVETEQWRQLFDGEKDIVYGQKGSGKSALYTLLLKKEVQLLERNTLLIPAEKLRGQPVFRDIVGDPPASEREFVAIWKTYFIQIIAKKLRDMNLHGERISKVYQQLEDAGLLPRTTNLRTVLSTARDYVKRFLYPESIEGSIGPEGLSGKVTLSQPTAQQSREGYVSIDEIFDELDQSLVELNKSVWVLLDRLDVAFSESFELERNALRALFLCYADFREYTNIRLKIFIRSDIWKRITRDGFREASHITRTITISWDPNSILNLVTRRILQSNRLVENHSVNLEEVVGNIEEQQKVFYYVFPNQVDPGSKRPSAFDWILKRTQDGTRFSAPREIIHLLSEARDNQIKKSEIGESFPVEDYIISGQSLKGALSEVSKAHLDQTLLAEYPDLAEYIEKLRRQKTQHNVNTLAALWGVNYIRPPAKVAS